MRSIVVNDVIALIVVVLLHGPVALWATTRPLRPVHVAAGGVASMLAVALVSQLSGLLGLPATPFLMVLGGLLATTLLLALVRHLRSRRPWGSGPFWGMVAAVGLGAWVLAPGLLVLAQQDLTFGLVTRMGPDIPNYVLAAQNLASSGFADSHHIANMDMGNLLEHDYIGAVALLTFTSAVTGLSPFQAAMPAMVVAVSMTVVPLWSLGRALWPQAPRWTLGVAVSVAVAGGLPAYHTASYFLGAVCGLVGVVTSIAGALTFVRAGERGGLLGVVVGGALGVFSYPQFQLPVLVVLPLVALVAGWVFGLRRRPLVAAVVPVVVAVVLACVLAAPTLVNAYRLTVRNSNARVGYPLPAMDPLTVFAWPPGIGASLPAAYVVASWLVVGLLLALLLVEAARRSRADRDSAVLVGLVCLGAAVVVLGCFAAYGATRYQSWKMQAFLVPMVVVAALPALRAVTSRLKRVGTVFLALSALAAVLGPWLVWSPVLRASDPRTHVTTAGLLAAAEHPALRDVEVLNVRLHGTVPTMGIAAALEDTVVVMTGDSYYPDLTSTTTCTLTTRDRLSPGEDRYTSLGGSYVLLFRPAPCRMKP